MRSLGVGCVVVAMTVTRPQETNASYSKSNYMAEMSTRIFPLVLCAYISSGLFSVLETCSPAKSQTLIKPLPACHMLPVNAPGNTECFDDMDRNGKFSYAKGDRAYDLKSWREYQLNSTF
jgi:hypothetical protein